MNIRQERFCEFVAAGESQTDAYLNAGFKVPKADARKHGARLMTKDDIKARISVLRAPEKAEATATKEFKRKFYLEVMSDPKQKMTDRLRASELDAKMAGHFEPDKVTVDASPNTLDAIRERARTMASALALTING